MKSIIIYFSRTDENYVNGALKYLDVGNTEIVAHFIKELTDADIFKIEPQKPYSKEYNKCIAEAQSDQRRNARPALKALPSSLDDYTTIYLGYPNYWGTMPMAVFSFLEHFDLSGKIIKPFCTHEGSGMGNSLSDIKKLCPKAIIKNGIAIHGANADRSLDAIKNWLKE